MKEELIEAYNSLVKLNIPSKISQNKFIVHFIDGAFLEVKGDNQNKYKVVMSNSDSGQVIHSTIITNNMWTRTNIKYFVKWDVKVYEESTNELVFEHLYNPKGKRVYIHFDSSAIGDTLAWFPYVKEFKEKWECDIIVSTFKNDWFKKEYPEFEFVKPGENIHNLYAMYGVGWYYTDEGDVKLNLNPRDFKPNPLQQTATDILGLEYKEIKPKISLSNKKRPIEHKYVVIAPHASAHAKYWNYPGGWQTIIDYLNNKGYRVMTITNEKLGDKFHDSKLGGKLKRVINMTGPLDIKERMNQIKHADLFIGVGSGLSWISWALGTKTILVSGFSLPETEFEDCERIYPEKGICKGCFNRIRLDPGDWEWCPVFKNTPRQYECTKTITPDKIIEKIEKLWKNN